jgi:hypothetical protein
MKHVQIYTRRIMLVLLLIVLPFTALFCSGTHLPPEGNVPAATSTPTSSAASLLSRPTPNDSNLILEFSREGSISNGGATLKWGPDTALIPLGLKGGAYAGSYEGKFNGVYSGLCTGTLTYPFSIDVTATEDGAGGLDFSVRTTMSMSGVRSCAGQGGP